jgi:hypothetical protein
MRFGTQAIVLFLLLAGCSASGPAQRPAQKGTEPQHPPGEPAATPPVTENILPPPTFPSAQALAGPGFLEPSQVKSLAHRIWIAEYRVNDLLSSVHPGNWKMSNITRNSFGQTVDSLRQSMQVLEDWRAQFEQRPDSIYFGFETYAAVNAVLPRLDGVGKAAAKYENPSLAAQYSEAANSLFDLQQALEPYIAYLLRNPDQALYVSQGNLAQCQSQLGALLRGQGGPAEPMKNTFVQFYPRKKKDSQAAAAGDGKTNPPAGAEKKAATPPAGAEKKAATPSH